MLTINIVSFEQLGPGHFVIWSYDWSLTPSHSHIVMSSLFRIIEILSMGR